MKQKYIKLENFDILVGLFGDYKFGGGEVRENVFRAFLESEKSQ